MVPVGITVEGANILTRTLITFAQGALRSHPYLYKEIQAVQDADRSAGSTRSSGVLRPRGVPALQRLRRAVPQPDLRRSSPHVPEKAYGTAEWYRQLWRAARNFALVADLTVALLGGGLKIKQKLTGRLADALVRALSALLRAEALRGRRQARRRPPHRGVCARERPLPFPGGAARRPSTISPSRSARWLMRAARVSARRATTGRRPIGSARRSVRAALEPGEVRDRLTRYIFVSEDRRRSAPDCWR